MNAVSKQAETMPTQISQRHLIEAQSGSLLAVISRAASDPNTDVEKLERMMGLYERITAGQAEKAANDAMNACQAEMDPVRKDAHNPSTKSKYATYAALDRAIRPIYTRHGFGVSFDTADCPLPEHIRVVAKVSHRDGHKEFPHLDMPADGKGAKGGDVMTKTHAIGAAVTYGKRYLLGMVFNIAVGDDDDGNSNGGREQSAAVSAAITAINLCTGLADLKTWKVKNEAVLPDLPEADQQAILRVFNTRYRKLKGETDAA